VCGEICCRCVGVILCLQAVLEKLSAQPLPLYVALLMKDVVRWRSSYDVDEANLPATTEAAFSALLDSLEMHLGAVFVSHTLAYITVAHNGLSEVRFNSLMTEQRTIILQYGAWYTSR